MADLPTKLQLTVVTRERRVLVEEVDEVVVPATDGYIGILPGHTPLLAMLKIGVMMYRAGGKERHLAISWGFAEVLPDRVILLAEGAYFPDEVDVPAAERERLEAEKELARLASNDPEFAATEAKLEESIAKIQVAGR